MARASAGSRSVRRRCALCLGTHAGRLGLAKLTRRPLEGVEPAALQDLTRRGELALRAQQAGQELVARQRALEQRQLRLPARLARCQREPRGVRDSRVLVPARRCGQVAPEAVDARGDVRYAFAQLGAELHVGRCFLLPRLERGRELVELHLGLAQTLLDVREVGVGRYLRGALERGPGLGERGVDRLQPRRRLAHAALEVGDLVRVLRRAAPPLQRRVKQLEELQLGGLVDGRISLDLLAAVLERLDAQLARGGGARLAGTVLEHRLLGRRQPGGETSATRASSRTTTGWRPRRSAIIGENLGFQLERYRLARRCDARGRARRRARTDNSTTPRRTRRARPSLTSGRSGHGSARTPPGIERAQASASSPSASTSGWSWRS